jgi:hypothetical protein
VHRITLARQVLADYAPSEGAFLTRHLSKLRAQAEAWYDDLLAATGSG